jgi:hypothetical protein
LGNWQNLEKLSGFFQNLLAFFKNLKKATGQPAGRTTLKLGDQTILKFYTAVLKSILGDVIRALS